MNRLARLHIGFLIAYGVLVLRLGQLQVIEGDAYRRLADQNRLRTVPSPAPRGLIVDRRGRVLATNHAIFRVALVPQELKDLSAVLSRVSLLTGQPVAALQHEFERGRSMPFLPVVIVPRVSKEVAIQLEQERWRFPGLLVKRDTVRSYPGGSTAAHLLGYLSQPTSEEMPLLKYYGVRPEMLIGRMGIEQAFDDALRGRAGGMVVEVNHRGRQIRVLGRRASEPGAQIALTIEQPLQSLIEQVLGDHPGACVVLDPYTGAVLAMASTPTFSPEAFATGDRAALSQVLTNPQSPLMNRATMGVYQPGSIMKLITSAAGLEHHVLTPSTTVVCGGATRIGDRDFHCWNRDGHGPMILAEALMQSCNVYFMWVGRKAGGASMREMMERVGFSHRTGWLLEEHAGHVPTRRLSEGDVAQISIGQGEVLVTVLQSAVMAGLFANGGWLVQPWVVSAVGAHRLKPPARRSVGWSPETMKAIRVGMKAVVADPFGTGHRAFGQHVSIAGKTGTAQTHVPGQTHAWFVGFCPIEQPRAAFAILSEYGGSGGDVPAPIAKAICEEISRSEISDE